MSRHLNPKDDSELEHDCPSCGAPSRVIDRFTLYGVPEPVEHVKVQCVIGHWFTIPTEWLAEAGTPVEPSSAASAAR